MAVGLSALIDASFDSRSRESHPEPRAIDSARAGLFDARPLACTHCASDRIVRWGAAHGLPRYRCLACKRTFNILTNTPLAHLRNRERWLTYVGTMLEGRSIRGSASACEVSLATSSRWRRRFLNCTAEERARVVVAVLSAFADSPALAGAGG